MPENVWPSFEKALEMGVDVIEMDIVVSKDNELIVSHDTWMVSEICLDPKGNPIPEVEAKKHNIFRMGYDEIQLYDCGTKPHPRFPLQQKMRATKPRLAEVVAKAEEWGKAHGKSIQYYIEIKSLPEEEGTYHPSPVVFGKLTYDAMKSLGILGRTTILSFDPRPLQVIKRLDPTVPIDFLVENKDGVEKNIALLGFRPDFYGVDYTLLTKKDVIYLHQSGIRVAPWTLNEIADIRLMVDMGIDVITTDYPDRAFGVLGKGK
jgi:glycerophosphoryl diester phosphodiesterase